MGKNCGFVSGFSVPFCRGKDTQLIGFMHGIDREREMGLMMESCDIHQRRLWDIEIFIYKLGFSLRLDLVWKLK